MKKILISGAGGQIGTELKRFLRAKYGDSAVIAADIRQIEGDPCTVCLDATDEKALYELVKNEKVDTIYNLVALLSAKGEANPMLAWKINIGALLAALNVSREFGCGVFTPSSIGAFGPDAPKDETPQDTAMHPNTIYGVCKVTGEMLGNYYHERFGVNARSVRFPGLISYSALPGGGTTDYAVEVFYSAIRGEKYICPIPHDRYMDMMYMPDALSALHDLMEVPDEKLIHRNGYNIASLSFTPEILFEAIKRRIPSFTWDYNVDPVMDKISDSWPNKMDDSVARKEWGWTPKWGLDAMIDDMILHLKDKV